MPCRTGQVTGDYTAGRGAGRTGERGAASAARRRTSLAGDPQLLAYLRRSAAARLLVHSQRDSGIWTDTRVFVERFGARRSSLSAAAAMWPIGGTAGKGLLGLPVTASGGSPRVMRRTCVMPGQTRSSAALCTRALAQVPGGAGDLLCGRDPRPLPLIVACLVPNLQETGLPTLA